MALPVSSAVLSSTPRLQPRSVLLDGADVCVSSEQVGAGRLGTVLRGTWLGQPVAIKRVLPSSEQRADPSARATLERELRELLPHLQHPCLLPLYGLYEDPSDGAWHLVYKLGARGSLRDLLRAARGARGSAPRGLPLADVFTVAMGVASALAYLHAHGISHGEMKPGAIIIDASFTPMLDPEVGIIRSILQYITAMQRMTAQRSTSGAFVHDAAYLAPEGFTGAQAAAGAGASVPFSGAGDVYSFGMIFYEMVSGLQPFPQLREVEIFAKLAAGERPPLPSSMPAPLAAIVQACWQEAAADRPSARDLLALLADARRHADVAPGLIAPAPAPAHAPAAAPPSGDTTKLTALFQRN